MPDAQYVDISENLITDGFCANCNNTSVWGVELGPVAPLVGLRFINNSIANAKGMAFFSNTRASIGQDSIFANNIVRGVPQFSNITSATFSNNTLADAIPSLNFLGQASYFVYRGVRTDGLHNEASVPNEANTGKIEAIFKLSASPRRGANTMPLYRCFIRGSTKQDFPSLSKTCEGQGLPHRLMGYSYEASAIGASPVYRCRLRSKTDHFLSWDKNCEGQIQEGLIAYALH